METTRKPIVSLEVSKVEAEISMALRTFNYSIQEIQNEANGLIINEDTRLETMEFLNKIKKVEDIIKEKHKELKKPHWDAGLNVDAAKNELMQIMESIKKPVYERHVKVSQDIARREHEQEIEKQRKRNIVSGIENNVITFANRIAECTTTKQLLSVESLINLEKANPKKYAEFFDQAIEKYDTVLKPIITDQKKKIKEAEDLAAKLIEAEKSENPEVMDDLKAKHEQVQSEIRHNQISVQENALNQTPVSNIELATVLFPTVKARRTTWEWEVKDIKQTVKKMPEWTSVNVNPDSVVAYLKAKKAEGISEGTTEFEFAGIRFFEKKTY